MPTIDTPLTIHLLTRDERLETRLLSLIASYQREGGLSCRLERVEHVDPHTVEPSHLMLVDLDSLDEVALQRITRFRQQGGRSPIVVISQRPSMDRVLSAMRAGARDYLPAHPTPEEFSGLLQRIAEGTSPTESRKPGFLVVVCSNKGGVGTTTVAINAAASLRTLLPGPVVLVDYVLQRGDVSVFLDVPTSYTTTQLAAELDRVDPSYLRGAIPMHRSGLHVLPAPYAPDDAELITPVQAGRLLEGLRTAFDAVVVDAGSYINDVTLAALDAADRIILVTLPSLPSIRNTKRSLELFERLHYDTGRLSIVVNRANARDSVPSGDMAQALGHPVDWTLPNDFAAAMRAMNEGTVLRSVQPKGALVLALDAMMAAMVASQRPQAANGSQAPKRRSAASHFFKAVSHGAS